MLDCACLAGIVALRHFRKPEVEVEGDEVTVVSILAVVHGTLGLLNENQHPPETRAPTPLAIHHTPICLTYALYSYPSDASTSNMPISSTPSGSFSTHKTYALLDPTHLEYTLSHGTLSIALNAQKELCVLQKNGGVPLEQNEILRLVDVAVRTVQDVDALVERRLKEDWDQRRIQTL